MNGFDLRKRRIRQDLQEEKDFFKLSCRNRENAKFSPEEAILIGKETDERTTTNVQSFSNLSYSKFHPNVRDHPVPRYRGPAIR